VSEESTTDPDEAIRRFVDAVNRRDIDTIRASVSPDLEWDTSRMGLVPAFTGRDAIRRVLEDWGRVYEDFGEVSREYRDLGNGVGLLTVVYRGRPRGGSRFLELRVADVVVWEDGFIQRMTTYPDIDEGRAAAERLAQERG
jgi:ketosteroid isomerase-like protein